MSKLPQDLQLVVSRSVTDSDSLMNVIDEEIYTRERAVTVLTPPHIDKVEILLLLLY